MLVAEWQVGQMLWTMMWFTLFFYWIWLVIRIFADIFRSDDLGGVAKTLWTLFVILTPYLGVFVYLIARGRTMADRDRDRLVAQEQASRAYIQEVAGSANGGASELVRLADLHDRGVLDDSEYERMKSKVVA